MLGFKFQLLPNTEGFWICSICKCIYECVVHWGKQQVKN